MSGSFLFVIPIIVIIAVALLILAALTGKGAKKEKNKSAQPKNRDRNAIVREANKRLGQNPRDAGALNALADVYFQDEEFEKARKTYELLVDLCATNKELDEFELTLRYAISSLRTKKLKDAYNGTCQVS